MEKVKDWRIGYNRTPSPFLKAINVSNFAQKQFGKGLAEHGPDFNDSENTPAEHAMEEAVDIIYYIQAMEAEKDYWQKRALIAEAELERLINANNNLSKV